MLTMSSINILRSSTCSEVQEASVMSTLPASSLVFYSMLMSSLHILNVYKWTFLTNSSTQWRKNVGENNKTGAALSIKLLLIVT